MKKKIVFIGNSIVNGFPMSRGRSFPGQVRAAIKDGQASFHADVINKGANGDTTEGILQRFEEDVLAHEPVAVFIMTGTNDFIYRESDPDGCMANLGEMARMAEEAGTVPVYMTPIAVNAEKASRMWMAGFGIDYSGINDDVRAFSDLIRESGVLYVDTWAAWEEYAGDESAWLDGVHPTPEGQQYLAQTVLEWMEEHAEELKLK